MTEIITNRRVAGRGIVRDGMCQIAVRVPPDLMDYAAQVAQANGISTAALLRNWIAFASEHAKKIEARLADASPIEGSTA